MLSGHPEYPGISHAVFRIRAVIWITARGDVDCFSASIRHCGNISQHFRSAVERASSTMQKRQPPSFFASLFGRLGKNKSTPAKGSGAPALRPFQSISIHHGTVCCASAKKVDGYRFLAKNAPQLPLSECTMRATCKCRYVKHDDRRSGSRRYGEFGLKQALFSAEERRRSKGRRTKD